jgi:pyruvate dehydrogenase E2 component (dihydrolipoamide acetyltransferase)
MSAATDLRARLKQLAERPPTLNDMVIKACGRVLTQHPNLNGSYRGERFEHYGRVNVGVAVTVDGGLIVPTIFDADQLSLGAIAAESRRLAARVRDGTATLPELSGATFTTSNLGMFGIDRFAGVINPPQAAILCVGAVTQRAAVIEDGSLAARPTVTLTLVTDHRIVYGADGARFLADVRTVLETPLATML